MKFFELIITFLILYSTNLGSKVQAGKLFDAYLKVVESLIDSLNIKMALVRIIILLAVFSLIIAIVYLLLSKLFAVLGFVFALFILFCCFSEVHFSIDDSLLVILNQAIHQLFSVLFWYLIFGPPGAVLYVLNDHICQMHANEKISAYAKQIQLWLDWLPVRLLAFCFALIGHFTAVSQVWLKRVLSFPQENELFLLNCFDAASAKEHLVGKESGILSEYLIKLIYRSLVVWFILIALIILL